MSLSIILYPRSYNKRGEESLHSVQGLSQDGTIINVKLRISEAMKLIPFPPSIVEFSRADIDAKNPCIATDDNSPENRAGVLLFSDVIYEKTEASGMKSYIAKWAVVLANKRDQPDPVFALGRMYQNTNSREVKKIKEAIKISKENGASENEISALEEKISDPMNHSFPVITYHPESLSTHQSDMVDDIKKSISSIIEQNTLFYPGILIRKINIDDEIYSTMHAEFFPKYIFEKMRYQTGEEFADYVLDKCSYWTSNNAYGDKIQVFLIRKIKSGPVANSFYSGKDKIKMLDFYYKNKDGGALVCNVAVRVSDTPGGSLLYKIYPLSHPSGEPHRLSNNLEFSYNNIGYRVDIERMVNEEPIGLTYSSKTASSFNRSKPDAKDNLLSHTIIKDSACDKKPFYNSLMTFMGHSFNTDSKHLMFKNKYNQVFSSPTPLITKSAVQAIDLQQTDSISNEGKTINDDFFDDDSFDDFSSIKTPSSTLFAEAALTNAESNEDDHLDKEADSIEFIDLSTPEDEYKPNNTDEAGTGIYRFIKNKKVREI